MIVPHFFRRQFVTHSVIPPTLEKLTLKFSKIDFLPLKKMKYISKIVFFFWKSEPEGR